MKTLSSSFRSSERFPAILLTACALSAAIGAPARAADMVTSYTRAGQTSVSQGFFASRHFYHESLFEKATRITNDGDETRVSFADHHRTDFRWRLGYETSLNNQAATTVPDGALLARTDLGHSLLIGAGYQGTASIDLLFDAVLNFLPEQEHRSGTFTFTLSHVVRLKRVTDELGITSEKEAEPPRTVEDHERALIESRRHLRGFAHPLGLEAILDQFKFDFRYPTLYFGLTMEATRHDQERYLSRRENYEAFRRRLAFTAGLSDDRLSAGLTVHVYGYNFNVRGMARDLAARLARGADHRWFLSQVMASPSVVLEGSVFYRPRRVWELGGRLLLTTFELDGVPAAFTLAPAVGRRLGEKWSAAVGGEMTLSSGSSSLSGSLFVAYYL